MRFAAEAPPRTRLRGYSTPETPTQLGFLQPQVNPLQKSWLQAVELEVRGGSGRNWAGPSPSTRHDIRQLGKEQGAKEIGHNPARERPKIWHSLECERPKFGHNPHVNETRSGHNFVGDR